MRRTAGRHLVWQALSLAAPGHRRHPEGHGDGPRARAHDTRAAGDQASPAAASARCHHLACRACGRTAVITELALEQWITAASPGRGLAGHLFQTCPRCATPGRPRPSGARRHETQ